MGQKQSNSIYFERRASEEQAAAERALDPRARQSHSDLAERYSRAARMDSSDGHEAHEPPPAMPLMQSEFRILP
jgi:hypothetical protein